MWFLSSNLDFKSLRCCEGLVNLVANIISQDEQI